MYGELSIKPWELHRMTFRDVMLSIDGVNKKREREYNNLSRLAVVVAHSGMNAKHAVNIMKKAFPPLGEPADTLAERARRALKKAQEFDIKQKLNAGRT